MEELLSLKWNNHKSTFLHILTILRDKQMFTDATLACEGKFYSVHRLVLSTCSDYFSAMFDRTECKNPIIVLKDINCEDLEALLDYMYLGEVNVKQSELSSLIKAAECLRVKGLAVPDDEIPKKGSSSKKSDSIHSPTAKRKRSDDEPSKSSRRRSVLNSESNNSGTESKPSTSVISEVVDKIPFVKVEREDIEDSFDVNHTDFKIENNDINNSGEDGSNQVPSFLPNEEAFADQAYSESYQPGDDGWPGEGSNFSDQLNFTSTDQSTNASGASMWQLGSIVEDNASSISEKGLLRIDRLGDAGGGCPSNPRVECVYCKKIFHGINRKFLLSRHLITHTDKKPFQCQYCPYKANVSSNLLRHVKTLHSSGSILFDTLTRHH